MNERNNLSIGVDWISLDPAHPKLFAVWLESNEVLILIEELYYAVRSHLRVALFSFVLVLAFVALIIIFSPRQYHSRAKLMVKVGRDSMILDPTATNSGNMIQLHRTSEHEMNTAIGEMASRPILENVVAKVGVDAILDGFPAGTGDSKSSFIGNAVSSILSSLSSAIPKLDPVSDLEAAVIQLEENLEIDAPAESSVVSVRYQTKSSHLAQQVVDTWLKCYVDQHVTLSRDQGAFDFLSAQADLLLAKLTEARDKLQAKKDASGLVTVQGQQQLLEQRLKIAADRLVDTESQLFETNRRTEVLRMLVEKLDAEKVMSTTSGLGDNAYEGIFQQLFALEADQKGLAAKMTDNHPRRIIVDEQVKQLKYILTSLNDDRETTVSGSNPTFVKLEQQLLMDQATAAGLEKKLSQAQEHSTELEKSIQSLNREENKIAGLSRDVDILEAQYRAQIERVEQSRFERAIRDQKMSSISILQPASFEEKPVSPKKMLCLLLGSMSAVCAAIGIPFFMYDRDRIRYQQTEPTARHQDDDDLDAPWTPAWSEKALEKFATIPLQK